MRRFFQLSLALLLTFPSIPAFADGVGFSNGSEGSVGLPNNQSSNSSLGIVNYEIIAKESAKVGKSLLNKSEASAIMLLEKKNIPYRIAVRDKKVFALTMDYSHNRINLLITKGRVRGFTVG